MDQAFRDEMAQGYALGEPGLILGSPILGGEMDNDARVQVALSMMNRHGLIAGATGTGKTKTLQLLAGELSQAGVPVFVADIKGDVTGMAAPGEEQEGGGEGEQRETEGDGIRRRVPGREDDPRQLDEDGDDDGEPARTPGPAAVGPGRPSPAAGRRAHRGVRTSGARVRASIGGRIPGHLLMLATRSCADVGRSVSRGYSRGSTRAPHGLFCALKPPSSG